MGQWLQKDYQLDFKGHVRVTGVRKVNHVKIRNSHDLKQILSSCRKVKALKRSIVTLSYDPIKRGQRSKCVIFSKFSKCNCTYRLRAMVTYSCLCVKIPSTSLSIISLEIHRGQHVLHVMHSFHIPSRRAQFLFFFFFFFFFFTNDFCETKQNKLEHELEPAWVLWPWISSALKEPLQQVLYCPLPCDIPWIETTTFPPVQDTPRPVANWFCAKISRLACSGYFNHPVLYRMGWSLP